MTQITDSSANHLEGAARSATQTAISFTTMKNALDVAHNALQTFLSPLNNAAQPGADTVLPELVAHQFKKLDIYEQYLQGLKEAYKFEVSGRPEDLPPPGQPTAADLVLYDSRSRELFRLYDEERLKSYSKVTVPDDPLSPPLSALSQLSDLPNTPDSSVATDNATSMANSTDWEEEFGVIPTPLGPNTGISNYAENTAGDTEPSTPNIKEPLNPQGPTEQFAGVDAQIAIIEEPTQPAVADLELAPSTTVAGPTAPLPVETASTGQYHEHQRSDQRWYAVIVGANPGVFQGAHHLAGNSTGAPGGLATRYNTKELAEIAFGAALKSGRVIRVRVVVDRRVLTESDFVKFDIAA